jgi:hypothetical protein
MVSNYPVALFHPLLYGRRTAPLKKDGRALEGKAHDCSATTQDGRDVRPAGAVTSVIIGPVRLPPDACIYRNSYGCRRDAIPATAPPSPTLWKHAVTGHRHASHFALYGPMSTAPSSPHAVDPQTGNLYTATLETAPGRAQDTP